MCPWGSEPASLPSFPLCPRLLESEAAFLRVSCAGLTLCFLTIKPCEAELSCFDVQRLHVLLCRNCCSAVLDAQRSVIKIDRGLSEGEVLEHCLGNVLISPGFCSSERSSFKQDFCLVNFQMYFSSSSLAIRRRERLLCELWHSLCPA